MAKTTQKLNIGTPPGVSPGATLRTLLARTPGAGSAFRAFADTIHDVVALHAPDGRFVWLSAAADSVLGYAADELVGWHPTQVTHAADRVMMERVFAEVLDRPLRARRLQARIVRKDGATRWVESVVQALRDEQTDQVVGLQTVSREVTKAPASSGQAAPMGMEALVAQRTAALEAANARLRAEVAEHRRTEQILQQSEARYRAIVEDQTEMVCRYHPDGTLTFVNAAYQRAFGRSAISLVGESVYRLIPGQNHATMQAHLASFGPNDEVKTTEYEHVLASGEHRWHQWTDRALFDADGTVVEFQAVGRDVTAQKRAAAEREALIEELDAFAHTVAHDLKAPLATLVGFGTVLADDFETIDAEQGTEFARHIVQIGYRMENIIDELMLLATVRKGEVEPRALEMGSLVDDALRRLGALIDEYSPTIVVPETWPEAYGHAPWITEVWVNYISNAIKYGGEVPRVELGGETLPNGMVRFWVHDNGAGLSAGEQERLFRPFERLDQVHARGHGLGLSIVRRIVDRLGGTASVTSTGADGDGCAFSFTLPTAESCALAGYLG